MFDGASEPGDVAVFGLGEGIRFMIMLIEAEGCKHDVKWYTWFMLLKEK